MHFVAAGSALLLLNNQKGKPHIWFVVTDPDPDDKVLIVMLRTRRRHTDATTVLTPGEYEFGEPVEGVIDYGATELVPVAKLVAQIRSDRALMKTPLSAATLKRIRVGLRTSGHTPNWVTTYLAS